MTTSHITVDDHSGLAYADIHPNEKSSTATGFLTGAAAYFQTRRATS